MDMDNYDKLKDLFNKLDYSVNEVAAIAALQDAINHLKNGDVSNTESQINEAMSLMLTNRDNRLEGFRNE